MVMKAIKDGRTVEGARGHVVVVFGTLHMTNMKHDKPVDSDIEVKEV